MSEIRDEPAFPTNTSTVQYGMTLRDYFAAKAMQGLLADSDNNLNNFAELPRLAYQIADGMLIVRAENE
jgi:hypothetical protein